MLAISYYPEWHGSPDALDVNLHTIATTYPDYEIDIAETAYHRVRRDGSPLPNSPSSHAPSRARQTPSSGSSRAANDVVDNQGAVRAGLGAGGLPADVPGRARVAQHLGAARVDQRVQREPGPGTSLKTPSTSPPGWAGLQHFPPPSASSPPQTTPSPHIPVRWQALPDGATDTPGEVVIVGTTALGKVTAVIDVI
ncbi:glycosyl hydrolase 53 family protein [Nonomuraea rubra]|uniref:glycosyl hydrolase 53 family protein n=1 Tax=Nonomuraea rubra TaxID=46180 RepID=UPI003CD0B938